MNFDLQARIRGAMVGTFIGDALGRPFEGYSPTSIVEQFQDSSIQDVLRSDKGRYSDDTQTMIALAESLLENNGVNQDELIQKFARTFDPARGYGASLSILFEHIRDSRSWQEASRMVFNEGSFGNGASMRIAPLPCFFFRKSEEVVWKEAVNASKVTHAHPHGYLCAAIMALTIHFVLHQINLNEKTIRQIIKMHTQYLDAGNISLCTKLKWIEDNFHNRVKNSDVILNLGNNVLAEESVFSSLFIFFNNYADPEKALIRAITLGGDTDTIGAMTGTLIGSLHGDSVFPSMWTDLLENNEKGYDYVIALADKIFQRTETV